MPLDLYMMTKLASTWKTLANCIGCMENSGGSDRRALVAWELQGSGVRGFLVLGVTRNTWRCGFGSISWELNVDICKDFANLRRSYQPRFNLRHKDHKTLVGPRS